MRRILVTGDRNWECFGLALQVIKQLASEVAPGEIVVVHGNARGVDRSFRSACRFLGVKDEPHEADWKTHGKGAGPIRNSEMVKLGADLCLAFHPDLSRSKGTRDCVTKALKAGIAVSHCFDGISLHNVTAIDDDEVYYRGDGRRFDEVSAASRERSVV